MAKKEVRLLSPADLPHLTLQTDTEARWRMLEEYLYALQERLNLALAVFCERENGTGKGDGL